MPRFQSFYIFFASFHFDKSNHHQTNASNSVEKFIPSHLSSQALHDKMTSIILRSQIT